MTPGRPPVTAILFDLWGTLIPGITREELDRVSSTMAAELGIDAEAFADAYRDSHGERFVGALGDLETTILVLARRCGGEPSATAVATAAGYRLDLTRRHLASDPETLAVLDALRGRGLTLALVSDCSSETPDLWSSSPLCARLDAVSFSCLVRARKPDRRLFAHALASIGRQGNECLYVGDGDGHELTGAQAAGMSAVRLAVPGDVVNRYEGDEEFCGPDIAGLAELLELPALAGARSRS